MSPTSPSKPRARLAAVAMRCAAGMRGAISFCAAAVCIAAIATPSPVAAATPPLEVDDLAQAWRWRTYDRDGRLPAGPVSALGHDRDDMIYVGTDEGLFRYNGYHWTKLASVDPLGSSDLKRIVESGGEIFLVTSRDVWVLRLGVELRRVYQSPSFLIAESPAGEVYVVDLVERTHLKLEKDGPGPVDGGANPVPVPRGEPLDYVVDAGRVHWLATDEGLYQRDFGAGRPWKIDSGLGPQLSGLRCDRLFLVKHQSVRSLPFQIVVSRQLWARFESPRGTPILARREDSGRWAVVSLADPQPSVERLIRDGQGNYYATTDTGALFFSRDGTTWERATTLGVGNARVRVELVDLFGYVWFALEYSERRGGVARFDPASRRWEQLAPADPDGAGSALERLIVRSLLEVDGAIWIGAESGVFRYEDGAVTAHRSTGNVVIRQVTGLALDAAKRVWISSPTFNGAYYFDGRWVEFRGERESRRFSETPVRHIITDRKGRLWFLPVETPGTSHEIYRFRFLIGNVPHLDRFELSQGTVNDMVHAQSGDYWAATDRGLVRLQLENRDRDLSVKRVYDAGNGLRSSRVWAVAESPVDRSIWVCYRDSGVSRIRGDRIDHFDESNGLESPVVWSIESAVIDEGANLWFGTDRGVSRYDGECWYHYSVAGLEPQMSQVLALVPSSSREDTVLVGTSGNGVFRFHQDDYRRPKFISTDFARRVQGSNLLRFAWDARDLKDVTPPDRLLFRHRVDGGPWSDFSSSRSVDLRLDPGEHTFEVQVRDLDGNANRLPLFQKFNVQAPRWAGPWLTVVVSAAGTALVILVALLAGRFLRRSFNPALSFRGAFRGLELPVVIVDPGGKVVDFNGVGAGLLGLEGMPRRRVSGVSILVVPLLRENAVRSAISSALEGRPTRCLQRVDDGSAERIVVVRAVPLRARRGDIVGAAVLVGDETREELERERGEFHVRMSAVRELAENIHHRLEDSLDEVRREITRLGSRAGDEDVIDGIRSRTEHVEELTRALGLFAGVVAPGQREEVSAPDLVEGVLHPSENGGLSIPEHVTVDLRGQPGLWKIAVDVDSVRQALREVLLNAIDAMPRGGRITIRMANQQRETNEGGAPAGRFVEISIADAGAGIDRTQVMRAFDPLYSTKPRTRHRGVGLSVAYGIVRSHGGDIRVESRKDAGTRVAIYLPAV